MTNEQQLIIRNALVDSYSNYAEGLDSKNWPLVRACFADEVVIDYGELSASTGAPDEPRRADDWMGYLQGVINGFDITRHLITNHRVSISDSEISCRAYLAADHVIFADPAMPVARPEDIVTVVGEYNNHYAEIGGQWKIVRSQLDVHYSHGNMSLFVESAKRVAAQG
ncbi:MAG: nuclear transport factor 2 family protein [Halioglobus sp.]|nr:nuclear transport factor 2 family protein [Halioglobus sp.]